MAWQEKKKQQCSWLQKRKKRDIIKCAWCGDGHWQRMDASVTTDGPFFFFFFFLSFFVVFCLFNFLVSLQRTSQLPGYHLRRTRPHFLQTPSITLCLCFNSRAAFINVRIAFQMEWKRRSVLFVLFCEFGSKLSRDPATGTDEITLTKRNIRHWARRCQCFHPYPQPLHP